jgi:predicted DNA-binding transcriptional regulator AlpA
MNNKITSREYNSPAAPRPRRPTALSQIRPIPRRGLARDEAAMYIGISAGKFDEMVADGRMPGPVKIDGRKVWDIRSLDLAFDALPREDNETEGSTWDDFRST